MSIWFGLTKVASTFVLEEKVVSTWNLDVFNNPHYGQEKKIWILLGSIKEDAWKPLKGLSDAV